MECNLDIFRWGYLEIRTSKNAEDADQAYGAGYLEGTLTADLIYSYWYNTVRSYCIGQENVCKSLTDFLNTNINWIKLKSNESDPYWYQVYFWLYFEDLLICIYLKYRV